ncbi:MAG: alpha/beta hydrolase [Gammaproteobacteria bacterium]
MNRAATRALACCLLATPAAAAPDLAALVVPPGEFAGLDTHRMYYRCVGAGSPTVVIDAGLGGSAVEWTPVQDALAAYTRVCTYDRAGYGWSDPGPSPRTVERAVAELRELLARAGEAPPYVLVGHSLGGFHARYMAARHADEVVALVLVESSHPAAVPRVEAARDARRHAIDEARLAAAANTDSTYAQASSYLNSRRKAVFAQMDELAHFGDSAALVAAAAPHVAMPLVVIARDAAQGDDGARERRWRRLQRSLLALSSHARFVVAHGAGHDVHLSRPEVIVEAVRALLERPAS